MYVCICVCMCAYVWGVYVSNSPLSIVLCIFCILTYCIALYFLSSLFPLLLICLDVLEICQKEFSINFHVGQKYDIVLSHVL